MKKKNSQNGVKGFIVIIILLCLILGYYYYLSNKKAADSVVEQVKVTAVQEALMRNLETNYPPSPREVIKYYGQVTQCFYNETYADEEFRELALKIQGIYDDELNANKTQEQYLSDLQWDISNMRNQEIVISSYAPASSTDVEYFSVDGFDWAKIRCSFTMRKGTNLGSSNEIFLLRKDADGHWKIYGWQLAEEE